MKSIEWDAKLHTRWLVAKGQRHRGECYWGVTGWTTGENVLVYLAVDGTRERLMVAAGSTGQIWPVTEPGYILNPHVEGGLLFWVEQKGKSWVIRAVNWHQGFEAEVMTPLARSGRPLTLSSCSDHGEAFWLVWEERQGRKTEIWLSCLSKDRFTAPVQVAGEEGNVYDPACVLAADGSLYLVYAAFQGGNYRIMLQRLDKDGQRLGCPIRVSDGAEPCLYPSIASCRDGGVWLSYIQLADRMHSKCMDSTHYYVQHARRHMQHDMFRSRGVAHVSRYDGERLWAPYAPQNYEVPLELQQGPQGAGIVFGATAAGHSKVFEDANGRVHLLFCQYQSVAETQYEFERGTLHRNATQGFTGDSNNYADICLTTLHDTHWSQPVRLIPRSHMEAPVTCRIDDISLWIAFTEDGRQTGWGTGGEWFDGEGEIGVGLARIELPDLGNPDYQWRPLVLNPVLGPSVEEPIHVHREGEYLIALGQTHMHSNLSICARELDRDPHLNYRFMQDVQHNDFGGVTDHDYNMWNTEMLYMRKLAEYYYFPGEFVAIPAYEWTGSMGGCMHEGGPFGHVNPLWLEEEGDLEVFTPCDPLCAGGSLLRLWQAYSGKRILTPPHHPVDNLHFYNWSFFDKRFVPVVELFQDMRGSAEQPWAPGVTNFLHVEEGHWIVEWLRMGLKFGFIGGGDHFGVARGGVLVKEITRHGLYEALLARRSFATTGIGLCLNFTCNGSDMGTEVQEDEVMFRVTAYAEEPLQELHILRNGIEVERVPVSGYNKLEHTWLASRLNPQEFWFCRLLFQNGEIAWTSPIWLSVNQE